MNFTNICVGIVITAVIFIVTGLFVVLFDDAEYLYAWILSSLGFGICLTVLLFQAGVV